jgi:D-lactate dehydrogenase (cytochrome)
MTTLTKADWGALEADLPQDGLVTDPIELMTYEVDGGLDRGAPQAVALPRSPEDVVRLVRWAAEHGMPLVARGAGTGLSGGAVPSQGGLVLSFSRMKEVLELDEKGRSVVVQPGLVNLTLDEMAKRRGLYYPPDPASGRSATLGGNLAENAGGPHCFKYGVTTNYVTGLQVVMASGEMIRTGGRALDYPEYDLTGLLIGSEGTLAIVTEASLRLMRNPQGVKTLMASFDSVEAAGEAVSALIARGLVPATMEMMDRNMVGIIEDYIHAGLPTEAAAMLIVEADGYPESLEPQMEEIVHILGQQEAGDLRVANSAAEREQIWYGRKSAFGAISRISPAYYVADGTVPRSKLAGALAGVNQICDRYDLRVGYVFHAGDGNLHPLLLFDPRDEDMVERVHRAGREIMELCVAQDGSISGEHGVGVSKRGYMPLMYNADELAAMWEIKDLFDPDERLNPGKVFPPDVKPQARPVLSSEWGPLTSPIIPESDEEAAEGLRAAQAAGQQVIIRGGKSQSLSATDTNGAVQLSTEKLRGVVAYAPEDLYVTARAGTSLAELQETLTDGLWAPLVSPWPESTLGGLLATNLNSPQRMRYGAIRDLVLGLRVVLPDGRRLRYGRPVVKNVAGYDMVKLFIGAYGTLGLVTEVTLRLVPAPRARRSLVASVGDLAAGLAVGQSLLDLSFVASAVLLCAGCSRPAEIPASPYLLVFTAEGHPQDVTAELLAARTALEGAGIKHVLETESLAGVDLWAELLREGGSHARIGLPPKDLSDYLEANGSALNPDSTSHIVDFASGLIHLCPAEMGQVLALREPALALGGYAILASSNGEGDSRVDRWGYAPETLPLMRRLKERWDPAGCLNSGVFVV